MNDKRQAWRGLMIAIIASAINDLQANFLSRYIRVSENQKDEAMSWFHGHDFESYCLALEIDPQPIREKAAELYRSSSIPDLLTPAEPPPPKVMSAGARAKISAALKGKLKSPEHKAKLRAAKLGTKQSPEHRKAISRANAGKKRSPEFSENLRRINTGRKMSEEAKAKMREAQRKRFDRPEERERARQNTLKRFSDPEERRKQAERTRAYAAKRSAVISSGYPD